MNGNHEVLRHEENNQLLLRERTKSWCKNEEAERTNSAQNEEKDQERRTV
jgi:hypothetical protein